jgi:hypothetical protein
LGWGILHFLNNARALWFAIGIWKRGVPGVWEWYLDVSLFTDFRLRTRPVIIAQEGVLHLLPQNNMKTEQPKRSCHIFTVSFVLVCIETQHLHAEIFTCKCTTTPSTTSAQQLVSHNNDKQRPSFVHFHLSQQATFFISPSIHLSEVVPTKVAFSLNSFVTILLPVLVSIAA